MPLPLYMDNDSANRALVHELRRAGLDVLTSREAGRERASDVEQLEFATTERRVLYTGNRRDFARIHAEWMAANRTHAGIVTRARQRLPVGRQVSGLLRICSELEAAGAMNRFTYL